MIRTAALALLLSAPAALADTLVVFAASSLQSALDPVVADHRADTGTDVVVSYASSAALARQIASGAPADLFISANADWMDWLEGQGALVPGTRAEVAGNALVLIAPGPATGPPAVLDATTPLDAVRIALGLTSAVPAGIYARTAFETLGRWDEIAPRVIEADSARGALAFVARAEAGLGIVYATDALAEPRVHVVATVPTDLHPPIVYPAALVRGGDAAAARSLLSRILAPAGRAHFAAAGFLPPPETPE